MNLKILFLPASLVLTVIVLVWMVKPEYDKMTTLKKEVGVAQEELNKIDSQVAAFNQALADYRSLGEDKQLIENALPTDRKGDEVIAESFQKVKDGEVLLTQVSSAAASTTSYCQNTAPVTSPAALEQESSAGSSTSGGAESISLCPSSLQITLSLLGQYSNIRKTIDALSKMNRFADVANLSIIKQTNDDANNLVATVSMNIFYKNFNSSVDISKLLNTPAGITLLSGNLDQKTIESFKESITNKIFPPVNVSGYGKENIFVR